MKSKYLKTQIDLVREHLLSGENITPMKAIAVFGCFRLASIIHDLRAQGMIIETTIREDAMGKRYAEYAIPSPYSYYGSVHAA